MKNIFKSILKSILLGIFVLFSVATIGQTKYNSLTDACNKNASGSGYVNNSKTIYIPSFTVGQYAFLNNQSRSFRRLGSGFYYNPATNSAFQTNLPGAIINIQNCTVSVPGNFSVVSQFTTGISGDTSYQLDDGGTFWVYAPTGERWSQMSVTYNDATNKLLVTTDDRGWEGSTDIKFKVEISPKWLTKSELEVLDFSNQKGQDIFILGQRWFANGDPAALKVSFVHIKGDANSNVPSFYKRASNQRMPQFTALFPNFTLSSTKTNVIHFHQLDASFNNLAPQYLNKGFAAVATTSDETKKLKGDYDDWAYEHGCMRWDAYDAYRTNWKNSHGGAEPPFANSQAFNINWLEITPIQDLYSWFQSAVINPGTGHKFVFLDFEAWGPGIIASQNIANKIGTLFRAFKIANPNTIFTNYINSKACNSRYGNSISASDRDSENQKYNKTYSQIVSGFFANNVQYLNYNTGAADGTIGTIGENITPIVGDYLLYINHDQLYSTIQEIELTRKHLPNNKMLSINWGTNENVIGSDYYGGRKFFRKNNGFQFSKQQKPPIPCSYAYNMAIWSNFLGDGSWWWDEPLPFVEGFEYMGTQGRKIDDTDYLPNDFSTNYGSMHYNPQIPYDYVTRALYELSLNNDILDSSPAATSPEFSINSGSSYYSGIDLLPASAEYSKLPIVRAKKHPTLNEWIVLVVNHNLDHNVDQTVKVKIDNKTVDVVLHGQFSTLKRIVLN